MRDKMITEGLIGAYRQALIREEKSTATVEKYLRDVRAFFAFIGRAVLTKELVMAYKQQLVERATPFVPSIPCWAALTACWNFWAARSAG